MEAGSSTTVAAAKLPVLNPGEFRELYSMGKSIQKWMLVRMLKKCGNESKEGNLLDFVHERLTILVNIMDRNNVRPIPVAINTKFLNFLQPEWSKYVTMVRHNQTRSAVSYDVLYDLLVQFEPHVLASRAKKAAKNHDPLLLLLIQMLLHHTLMQTLLILHNHTMSHILHQSLIMMMNIKGSYKAILERISLQLL
ncbi:hypothetical protein Tco_0862280 [Tanacetum coccineum]